MYQMSYKLGVYQAIAEMMRDRIRELEAAQDDFDREWEMKRLVMLAEQLDEAEERFKKELAYEEKEVDSTAL